MVLADVCKMESLKVKNPGAFIYGDFEEWLNVLPRSFGFLQIEYQVSRNGADGVYMVSYYPTKKDGKNIESFKEILKPYLAD